MATRTFLLIVGICFSVYTFIYRFKNDIFSLSRVFLDHLDCKIIAHKAS